MGVKMLLLNALRTFNKKKLQLFAIGIIVFLSSFMYTMTYYAINSMKVSMEELFEVTNQEEYSLNIVNGLMPYEMEKLIGTENEQYITYSLTDIKRANSRLYEEIIRERENTFLNYYPDNEIEIREYKETYIPVGEISHKMIVIKDSKAINHAYIEEGVMPSRDREIAITPIYARSNDIAIGDAIEIQGKSYIVTGYVLFPDFVFPVNNDFIIDNSKMFLSLTTDRSYERITGDEKIHFAGVSTDEYVRDNFQKEVIDTFDEHDRLNFITSIVLTEHQMRSGLIYMELEVGEVTTVGISILISAIAVMMVAILTSKILKSERGQIGVLKALGYSKYEIATPYILILLVVSLPALLLGYLGGSIAARPMMELYLDFFLLPDSGIITSNQTIFIAVGVPLFFILGLSGFVITRLLDKRALDLMKVSEDEKLTRLNKIVGKLLSRTSAQTKYKYSYIFKNTGKFVLFFVGISLATNLIIMSFMMTGFFDRMTVDYYESTAYQYEGYIDVSKSKPVVKSGQERVLQISNAFYDNDQITLKGLEPTSRLHTLYNPKGEEITPYLQDGVIINQSFAMKYGVKKGDVIPVVYDKKVYEVEVKEISKDYGDAIIYWERTGLSRIVTNNKSKTLFTSVLSEEPLNERMYSTVISKADIMEQTQSMQQYMEISMTGMMGAAVFIAVLILYVLTTLTVEDSYYSISLLKVLGYNKKEVNGMILNSYLVYAIAAYLVTMPVVVVSYSYLMVWMSRLFDIVMPLEFRWWHSIAGLIMIVIIFELGAFVAKRKVEKVSLQEVLKAYRE